MRNSGRSQAFIPAVVVVVVVLVGFFAMRSRGDDGDGNNVTAAERKSNCGPIARADAASTRPGEPVLVDVLANDTDADGDALVFQILKTEGGTSEIDDGDTPTDSGDDRLSFTPSDPPSDSATVEYQALDPEGEFSISTLTIAVNPDATLPDGVRSALASDPAAEGTQTGRCGESEDTTTTTLESVDEAVESTTTIVEDDEDTTTATTSRRTATTRRSSTSGRTTTTTKKSSGGSTNTTSKPSSGPGTTNAPSVPAPGDPGSGSTTTKPTSPPTTDAQCGSPESNPNFRECIRGKSTTTAPPAGG